MLKNVFKVVIVCTLSMSCTLSSTAAMFQQPIEERVAINLPLATYPSMYGGLFKVLGGFNRQWITDFFLKFRNKPQSPIIIAKTPVPVYPVIVPSLQDFSAVYKTPLSKSIFTQGDLGRSLDKKRRQEAYVVEKESRAKMVRFLTVAERFRNQI